MKWIMQKKKMDDILFINHDRLSDKFLSARKNHFVTLGSWYWLCFMFRKKASTDTFAFRKPSRMLYRLYAFRLCALFHRRRSKSLPNGMASRFTFHRDELITENFSDCARKTPQRQWKSPIGTCLDLWSFHLFFLF